MKEWLYKRKSCRKYANETITDSEIIKIKEFISNANVLNDSEFTYEILKKDEVSIKNRWSAPYYLAIYSKDKLNSAFVFEQLCLFMNTLGIGNCWVGIDSPKVKKEDYVISIAFGKSDNYSRTLDQFKRKNKKNFSDSPDERLLPAYYAPSAINSQPWYFKHSGEGFDVYQVKHNFLKRKVLGKWSAVDMGICLAHLYIANPDTFNFKINAKHEDIDGYTYFGSITL